MKDEERENQSTSNLELLWEWLQEWYQIFNEKVKNEIKKTRKTEIPNNPWNADTKHEDTT